MAHLLVGRDFPHALDLLLTQSVASAPPPQDTLAAARSGTDDNGEMSAAEGGVPSGTATDPTVGGAATAASSPPKWPQRPVEPDPTSAQGETPLGLARALGHLACARVLERHGAHLDPGVANACLLLCRV